MILATLAATAGLAAPASAEIDPGPPVAPETRLAAYFARTARQLLRQELQTVAAIDAALILAQEAARLEPSDPERWRLVAAIASLAERDDIRAGAMRTVARLDPRDDVARLAALNDALERYQTAEERAKAAGRLLEPASRDRLGVAVASRLALDLALLEERRGRPEEYARWLAESVALDPANRTAAAMAAGYFRMHTDDRVGEAELLVNLLLADPTDVTTQLALAELLLEGGAYRGAERLYRLAVRNLRSREVMPADDLLADLAIAQWGAGNDDGALATIRGRQSEIDEALQSRAKAEDPARSPIEVGRVHAPIGPALAAVRAAILRHRGDAETEWALSEVLAATATLVEALEAKEPPEHELAAARLLDAAWIAAWLGRDPAAVEALVAKRADVPGAAPLPDVERLRLSAWLALSGGDGAEALRLFELMPSDDAAAAVGRAEALEAAGRPRDAAALLLAAARARPGALVGVWAVCELARLLGRRPALTDEAAALESLIASVPTIVDRFPEDPTLAIDIRMAPRKSVVAAYEPIVLDVTITNHSPYPLAIDRQGPIRPHVLLRFTISHGPVTGAAGLPPAVIGIDRRLRLQPRESVTVPVDLMETAVGALLTGNAKRGLFLEVNGMVNYNWTNAGAIEPGLLGDQHAVPTIRVEGARIDARWMEEAVGVIATLGPEHLAVHALLLELTTIRLVESAPPEYYRLLSEVNRAIGDVFAQLPAAAQAWLIATVPEGRLPEPIDAIVRESDDRLVRIVAIVAHLGPDDPLTLAARTADDPALRRLAELAGVLARTSPGAEDQPAAPPASRQAPPR
jgi:tetratricopeptide (TPR) repeat protein